MSTELTVFIQEAAQTVANLKSIEQRPFQEVLACARSQIEEFLTPETSFPSPSFSSSLPMGDKIREIQQEVKKLRRQAEQLDDMDLGIQENTSVAVKGKMDAAIKSMEDAVYLYDMESNNHSYQP